MKAPSKKKLKIGIIDLVHKGPTTALYAKVMNPNFTSIMPQVIAVWCEQEGHSVHYFCYSGFENLENELPENMDFAFICAFTQSALLAYAISNKLRGEGSITVLGGPHARCYPEDAAKYFDYVTGFTNRDTIIDILKDGEKHHDTGTYLSANAQPDHLPGLTERWKFIEATLRKAPFLKIVPMLSSVGCPYACPFCIDADVPYKMMESDALQEDLRFIVAMKKKPMIAWHDPNFGVRFNESMGLIEEAVPPGTLKFVAESSLSVLTEKNLKRLQKNGFLAIIPGIESWQELGKKSKTANCSGIDKVLKIAEHIKLINAYIPYIQTNMIFGLDSDYGSEPFDLSKKFVDLTPGILGGYALLTSYGEAAPINLSFQKDNRVLPFPFNFLNNELAMNVKPKNYDWITFYDHLIDITAYTFSWKAIIKRSLTNTHPAAKTLNFIRGISREGFGRLRYFKKMRHQLVHDKSFRDYFEGNTTKLPQFYHDIIKQDMGYMLKWLPKGAMFHDHLAYMKKQSAKPMHKKVMA
jgi:hypothetical protein